MLRAQGRGSTDYGQFAVTEAVADDTTASLLGRAETALDAAKRYGHNRTFAHGGKFPTPVIPPEMTVEEKRIPVGEEP